jgi:hypothetical protein
LSSKSKSLEFIRAEDALDHSPVPWFTRLWAAVIRRAAVDWVLYREHPNPKLVKLGLDADTWVFSFENDSINSFESVCSILDIKASVIRDKITNLAEEDARKLRGMEFGDEW